MIEAAIANSGLNHYIEVFGYLGIFLFFATVDQLTFVPEEVTLISIGYLAAGEVFNPIFAGLIALAAFLSVDTAYYFISGSGLKIFDKLRKKMSGGKVSKWKEKLREHFPKTLLLLCFIPRMRMWAPVFSGLLKIPYGKFITYDSIALGLFTALYVCVGYFFHRSLDNWMAELRSLRHAIFAVVMLLLGIFIFFMVRNYNKKTEKSGAK